VWAEFPADFTIWLESIFAWRNTVVSDSYFTHWAGALVNTNTSSVCLFPAGVILLLIPELLKVLINIVLFLSLCLLGWLSFGLLGSSWVVVVMMIIVSLMVWVMKWVMDIVMISDGVLTVVIVMMVVMVEIVVFWVLTIDEMWLSVFGLIGFMDGLWVDVMVIVVEESVISVVEAMVVVMVVIMMVVMVVIAMDVVVCTIVSVYEWVVVDGFVVMVIVVVSMMISMVVSMPVSMVATKVMVIVVIVMVCLFMTVMVSVNGTIFFMIVVVDVVVSVSEAMSVSVVTPVGSPFTVVSMSISVGVVVFMSESMISVKSPGFVVSSSPPVSMVWGLVVRSVEVRILMVAFVWKNVTNSDIISIVMSVSFSHVVSPVSLGVLHFLSVSTNVVVVMWVWELMWEDLEWSLSVVLGIDNTDVSGIMVIIMVAEVVWVVLIMDVVVEVVSIYMSFKSMSKIMLSIVTFMTILEMWLFVKSVLDMMTIISKTCVFTMHVVAFVTELMSESVLSNEHWVGFGSLSELLSVLDLGAICSLVLMWGHLRVSFWENTLIRVSIVMMFSTGVVSLV
jgi:hypothetical protein